MNTLRSILVVLALVPTLHAETITRADIVKTVEHLQQRCHQAETAQTAAQSHAVDLQDKIDTLAEHDRLETQKAADLQTENGKLKSKVWKLAWIISGAIGVVVGLIFALCPFPFPARVYIPILVGALTTGGGALVIRYLGL